MLTEHVELCYHFNVKKIKGDKEGGFFTCIHEYFVIIV
jgi:hypothetical protein